jgi:hypothetical protein
MTGLFFVTTTVLVKAAKDKAGVNSGGQGNGEQIEVAATAKA